MSDNLSELFKEDTVDKKLTLTFSGGEVVTNVDIYSESMSIAENLCSESELTFGACEAGVFKIKIANSFISHIGQTVTVSETLAGNTDEPYVFGKYNVTSDKPTADRCYRQITAYDDMYVIIHADVSGWYNDLLPDEDSTVTLKEFRDSFFEYFGIEQEEISLVNDSMTVEKTIDPEELSGKDVITSICEINGCFGHIGRDGKFQYIHLKELIHGLYPAEDLYPADDLYPSDPGNSEKINRSHYISCDYEDFETKTISKLQIRQEENDIGAIYPDGEISDDDNCYIIEDNFLVYGKGADDLEAVAQNIYSVINKISYRPASVEAKGNPCLMVGDGIRLVTKHEIIYTYILQRTLKGIQSLRDSYDAEGEEKYYENVNGIQSSIVQLKGKTNTLTRTVEETQSRLENTAEALYSTITQTASEIRQEVANTAEGLQASITVNAEAITSEVTRATNAEDALSSTITQTASEIRSEVKNTTDGLSSRISQTAKSIAMTVNNGSTTAGITISITTEGGTTSSVSGNIEMTGLVSFTNLSTSGSTQINGANITTGTISADRLDIDTIASKLIETETMNAKYATINSLDAANANIEYIVGNYVTASTLESNYLTAGEISGQYATISSLDAATARISSIESNYITADYITAKVIMGKIQSTNMSLYGNIGIVGNFAFQNLDVVWGMITVGATTYTVLMKGENE